MKKLIFSFLIGILLLGMTACGNTTAAKDVTANFKNSVFMGDSITEGFAVNEILPKECVIAGAGATAGFIYANIDALVEKKPDKIFIMLGSCDLLMPVDDPKELFRNDLKKLIHKIMEGLPDSKIYLLSVTPVTQSALKEEPRYKGIEEYNQLLKELADKLSVNYVDIGTLAQENPDLYAEDGIHFKKEFYWLWLERLSKLM
ncbi:GDSL-type esterase/lipase family protein [Desulforamulus aquiferis]|uniref:GDSL-type esterase/lipase family protein n=1 Tax=Desulforamulus aquiferis TaxID=1397668 RepID=A0AAW7Z8Q0_9FIRM|nr:GDSL-type esterase/lipase family protein [Desulforamulus aquiferis]MDO7785868.1 GDSL-type esterase/lipase family protein [Desulforamulus aquiferis]RYD02181.1 lipase [Desulforamulus aquiferis]